MIFLNCHYYKMLSVTEESQQVCAFTICMRRFQEMSSPTLNFTIACSYICEGSENCVRLKETLGNIKKHYN